MARTFSVEFNIGAAMGSTFRRTMGNAQERVQELGATMRRMSKQRLAAENVQKYARELDELRRAQSRAGHGNTNLNRKIAETQRNLREATQEAKKHGVAVDKAAQQYDQLGKAMAQAERRQKRLQIMQGNQDARQQMHGQFMGVAAAGAAVAFPVKQAIEFESTMADVKKVISFEKPEQFEALSQDVLGLSRRLPMAATGIGDIMAAAGQAGVARDELGAFAEAAIKMGTAFDMTGRQAGKVMANWREGMGLTQNRAELLADAVNHLSNNMNAEAGALAEVIQRQGAAAQAAGLHETEIASLGAALLSSGTGPERAATALKKLTISLTQGEKAPGRVKDALSELGFSAEGMATRMQKDAKGSIMAVFEALKSLPEAARPGMIKELFGEESQGAIAPLLQNLGNLQGAFEMTGNKTSFVGSMQAEYEERSKTTANQVQMLKNRVSALGVTLGGTLLPALNAIMKPLGRAAGTVADLAEEHPVLTKTLIGTAAGLVGLKIATLGARYGFTLISDAVQLGKATFDQLRPSVLKANALMVKQKTISIALAAKQKAVAVATTTWATAQKLLKKSTWASTAAIVKQKAAAIGAATAQRTIGAVTKAWTAAQWALNAAMSANPIGLVVAGVAALGTAAYFLITKWDTVKSFFGNLWDWIKNVFSKGLSFIKGLILNFTPLGLVKQAFQPVKDWLSNFNLFEAGKNILKTLGDGIKSVAKKPKEWVGSALKKVRDLLPFSDAKEGPFSQLTASGRSVLETMGQGIKQAGPGLAKTAKVAMAGTATALTTASHAPGGLSATERAPQMQSQAPNSLADTTAQQTSARPAVDTRRPMPQINLTINIDGQEQEPTTEIRRAGQEAARETRRAVEEYFQRGVRLGYA